MKNGRLNKEVCFRIVLVLLGLLLAYIWVLPHWGISEQEQKWLEKGYMYMSTRWKYMGSKFEYFRNGVLPDLTNNTDHGTGIWLYGSYIGYKMGYTYGYEVFAFFQISSALVLMSVYPIMNYICFKSKIYAVLSPVLLHFILGKLLYISKTDVHWAAAWGIVMAIPIIVWLYRRKWDKISWLGLGFVALIISYVNIIRAHSGIYLLLITLIVLIKKMLFAEKNRKHFLMQFIYFGISLIILLGTYNLLSTKIPNYILERAGQVRVDVGSTLWHNIYIGFGAIENEYGLYYSDDCGREGVKTIDESIVYPSVEYNAACKQLVINMLKKDPLFCLKSWIIKFGRMCLIDFDWYKTNIMFNTVIILGVLIKVLDRKKRLKSIDLQLEWLVFTIITIFSGMLQPVLSYPGYTYGMASIAAYGMVALWVAYIICMYYEQYWRVQVNE